MVMKSQSVKWSVMSGKMKGFYGLNTNPFTNKFCEAHSSNPDHVCTYCYAKKFLSRFRSSCVQRFEQNSRILQSDQQFSVEGIPDDVKYVRFNGYGELINATHFANLCEIARLFPDKKFSLFTKRKGIVAANQRLIPDNLVLVYSKLKLNPENIKIPKGYHKVFSVFTPGYVEKHGIQINCKGECIKCLQCYTKNSINFMTEVIKAVDIAERPHIMNLS